MLQETKNNNLFSSRNIVNHFKRILWWSTGFAGGMSAGSLRVLRTTRGFCGLPAGPADRTFAGAGRVRTLVLRVRGGCGQNFGKTLRVRGGCGQDTAGAGRTRTATRVSAQTYGPNIIFLFGETEVEQVLFCIVISIIKIS